MDPQFEDAKDWHRSVDGFIRKSSSTLHEYYQASLAEDVNKDRNEDGDAFSDGVSVADSEEGETAAV